MTTRNFSCIVLFFTLVAMAAAYSSKECVYTLYVQTGTEILAGTDANIGVTLSNSCAKSVHIPNLKQWGLMGPEHNYFERGNLDIFSVQGQCITPPICRMNLTSDGTGFHPGWFVEFVEVTFTGPHKPCSQTLFFVNQWLSVHAPPFRLSAVLDGCKDDVAEPEEGRQRLIFVGNTVGSASG